MYLTTLVGPSKPSVKFQWWKHINTENIEMKMWTLKQTDNSIYQMSKCTLTTYLTLYKLIRSAADSFIFFFFFVCCFFLRKYGMTFHVNHLIHMKCQALFSVKNNLEKKIKMPSATILLAALRVKPLYEPQLQLMHLMVCA